MKIVTTVPPEVEKLVDRCRDMMNQLLAQAIKGIPPHQPREQQRAMYEVMESPNYKELVKVVADMHMKFDQITAYPESQEELERLMELTGGE